MPAILALVLFGCTSEKPCNDRHLAHGSLAASVLLAQVHAQQGKLDEGLSLVDSIERDTLARDLGPVEALEYARGDLLARMNRLEEADTAFRTEIATFPRDRQAYSALAILYRLRNDTDAARTVFVEMARANPNKSTYLYAAHSLEQLDDPSAAAEWRQRAARVDHP